jgi:hypothetical protein
VILLPSHPVVKEKLEHLGLDSAAIIQIEREKPFGIHYLGRFYRAGVFCVVIL